MELPRKVYWKRFITVSSKTYKVKLFEKSQTPRMITKWEDILVSLDIPNLDSF